MVTEDRNNPYLRFHYPIVADNDNEGPFVSEEVACKLLQEPGGQYSFLPRDSAKALWVVTGVSLVALAVGIALWLESSSQKSDENKPKTEYHSPANQIYSPTPAELTSQGAYLKDGTSYQFYIINNEIAVTKLGGKPVIDSLEGKLGK